MENIAVFPVSSRFPVKIICCIAFGSALCACCLLRSVVVYNQLVVFFEVPIIKEAVTCVVFSLTCGIFKNPIICSCVILLLAGQKGSIHQ